MNPKFISDKEEILAKARSCFPKAVLDYIDKCLQDEHPHSQLIPILHKVQDHFGYLSGENLDAIAQIMKIPAAKVSGVATFYHYFTLQKRGQHVISVCMGTACYVKGADRLAQRLKEILKVDIGEVTEDGLFTIIETRCLGMCAMAPVMKIDEEVFAKVSLEQLPSLLEKYKKK